MAATYEDWARDQLGPTDALLLRSLVRFRVIALAGVALALVLSRRDLTRPAVAAAGVVAAVGFTAWTAYAFRTRPRDLFNGPALMVETLVAAGLQVADGWALVWLRAWEAPALGSVWIVAAPVATGVARGPLAGGLGGLAIGAARPLGLLAPDIRNSPFATFLDRTLRNEGFRPMPLLSLCALYVMAGAGAGYLARKLRAAEEEVATARVRDEVSRQLHDGVLQTLSLLGTRVPDPALSRLARDSERDLRGFLFGRRTKTPDGLEEGLRETAAAFARTADMHPQVVIAPDLPNLDPTKASAVVAAVGEALANVVRHARASSVTLYAGPDDDGVLVTVKDDGVGFEPGATPMGQGISRSITDRLTEAGGRSEIRSAPGRGTEVALWIR